MHGRNDRRRHRARPMALVTSASLRRRRCRRLPTACFPCSPLALVSASGRAGPCSTLIWRMRPLQKATRGGVLGSGIHLELAPPPPRRRRRRCRRCQLQHHVQQVIFLALCLMHICLIICNSLQRPDSHGLNAVVPPDRGAGAALPSARGPASRRALPPVARCHPSVTLTVPCPQYTV